MNDVELPLPVREEIAARALRIAEPGEIHGKDAVMPREPASHGVPGVARLQEPADQHDRRATRAEALVLREHAGGLDEASGRCELTGRPGAGRRDGVVDRRASRHTDREHGEADEGALGDSASPRHAVT
jgi:hypothetical protein